MAASDKTVHKKVLEVLRENGGVASPEELQKRLQNRGIFCKLSRVVATIWSLIGRHEADWEFTPERRLVSK